MSKDLMEEFSKFLGKPVKCTEKKETVNFRFGPIETVDVLIDEGDETVKEIRDLATSMGIKIRVMTPTMVGTADYVQDRVNVAINRGEDGYVVTNVGVG